MKKKFRLLISNQNRIYFLLAIVLPLLPFYQIILLNRTFTTASVTPGVMADRVSKNFEATTLENSGNINDRGGSAWQDQPLSHKVANAYHSMNLPFWNSSQGFGRPLGADMMSGSFSIFQLPHILFPSIGASDFIIILRICTASLGAYLFFRKQKISSLASLIGGIAFSLSGYFSYYHNMGHIQVEVLLPWLLLASCSFKANIDIKTILYISSILLLMLMGGHPESMIIALIYSVVFMTWKIWSENDSNHIVVLARFGILLAVSIICSIIFGAFFLIPFFEYFKFSYVGYHEAKFAAYNTVLPVKLFFLQLFPLLTKYSIQFGINNHWATLTVLFSVFTIWNKKHRSLVVFLALSIVVLLAKIYGLVPFEWLGKIPILNNFSYEKYLQPELSFSIAFLSALGFDYFQRQFVHKVLSRNQIVLSILVLLVFYALALRSNAAELSLYQVSIKRQLGAIVIPIGSLLLSFSLMKLILSNYLRKYYLYLLAMLLIIELMIVTPAIRVSRKIDPYSAQPGVSFLLAKQRKEPFRIYSPDGLMYPSTSSVFGLQDIRDLHAVYPSLYAKYIKEFIYPDFLDRFSDYSKEIHWQNNPFFNLTNTKYILTKNPLALSTTSQMSEDILQRYADNSTISETEFTLNNITKKVVFAHAPNQFTYTFIPTSETSVLRFSPVIDPAGLTAGKSDGVNFKVILEESGEQLMLSNTSVLPGVGASDEWKNIEISLLPFLGKNISLTFITSPLVSNAYDWSGWGDLRLTPVKEVIETKNQFQLVFSDEINIYENTQVIPRAFVVSKVFIAHSESEVFESMKSQRFDPQRCSVILSNNAITIPQNLIANSIEECSTSPINSSGVIAQIYTDSNVEFKVTSETDGFMHISDLYYPGWKATIDSLPVKIFQSDGAFRGVFIEKGTHIIVFSYSSKAYRLGATITIVGLISTVVLTIYRFKIHKKSNKVHRD